MVKAKKKGDSQYISELKYIEAIPPLKANFFKSLYYRFATGLL